MALLLKGGPVAEAMSQRLLDQCATLKEAGVTPVFAIVRVGEKANDISYERGATKRAQALGVEVRNFILPESVTEDQLVETLEGINHDSGIHGCLMFRPLPPHLDILKYYQIPLQGKRITVIGKSMTVGLPTALLMMNEEATVSVCHILSRPEDTRDLCKDADIIISAAGCPGLVTRDYVRHGQIVVDVGVTLGKDGKLHGDVAFEEVEPIVEAITPVPGGVGSVTSTVLVGHVVEAAMRRLWKDQ